MHKIIMFLKALALVFLISSIASVASAKTLGINGQTARLKNDILAAARPHLTEEDARHLKAGWLIPVINVPLKTTIWSAAHDFVVSGGQTSSVAKAPVPAIAPVVLPPKPQAALQVPVAKTAVATTASVAAPASTTVRSNGPHIDSLSTFAANNVVAPQVTAAPAPQHPVVAPIVPPPSAAHVILSLLRGVGMVIIAIVVVLALIAVGIVAWFELDYQRGTEYEEQPIHTAMRLLMFWKRDESVAQTDPPAEADPEAKELPQYDPKDEKVNAAGADFVTPADTGYYREDSRGVAAATAH